MFEEFEEENRIEIAQKRYRVLAFIDYIFLIGLIIASTDKNNRRIGDMVAKTLVVKEK